jgi:hypothetical protein
MEKKEYKMLEKIKELLDDIYNEDNNSPKKYTLVIVELQKAIISNSYIKIQKLIKFCNQLKLETEFYLNNKLYTINTVC